MTRAIGQPSREGPEEDSATAEPTTLAELLYRASSHPRGRETGLRFVDRLERAVDLPWVEVVSRASRAAARLRRSGVEGGDPLPLVFATSPEFFDAFFGALLCGAVPVPLYPPLRLGPIDDYESRTARMVEAVGAKAMVVAAPLRERLRPLARRAAVTLVDLKEVEEAETLGAPAALTPPSQRGDDLALVQFSSGSTGEPRPVALSHAALLAQARRIGDLLPDDPHTGCHQSGVSWLPLYHDMGLIGCVLPALERPADLTLLAPEVFVARPAIWLRTLSRYRATASPAPTFAFDHCVERLGGDDPALEGVDLSSWTAALVGAETVVPTVLRRFAERFSGYGFDERALTPVYGLAEAALAVTTTPIGRRPRATRFDRRRLTQEGCAVSRDAAAATDEVIELVSLGRPLPGFAVEVRSRSGEPCAPGEVGRVHCRGPSLMAGYLGQPEASARALAGGWLDTGDLGFLHDGELHLTGRAKDVLVIRGRNHSPEPIEQTLREIPGVGAAVASSSALAGGEEESLLLFVERRRQTRASTATKTKTKTEGKAEADESSALLARRCREAALRASGLGCAAVVVVDAGALPRTSSGKLRRREALQRYLEGRLLVAEEVRW